LFRLTQDLLAREWPREDKTNLRIGRLLIDSGYVPEVVHDVVLHSGASAILVPSRGVGIGATGRPMSEWDLRAGEYRGQNWLLGRTTDRTTRVIRYDANFWKTFIHARLSVPIGDPGSLSLYGSDPGEHRLLSEHLTAEAPTLVSAKGRTVAEWSMRPGQSDNHFLDTAVMCAVGASVLGAVLPGTEQTNQPGPKIKLSELWERKHGRRSHRLVI
jgi:phage terminase large subunit GpA-like protein